MGTSGVYRTAAGLILRITDTVEAGLKVEVLKNGSWMPGRIGMVGLRLAPSTTKLGAKDISALPA